MTTQELPVDQRELLQKAERYFPGACLAMIVLPTDLRMVMERGRGSKVYDVAGREYLDYMLGSGPLVLGHCRSEVVEAVQRREPIRVHKPHSRETADVRLLTTKLSLPRKRGRARWRHGMARR